jgi:1-acyl-sn-glycerol-3-phosphate acyltransferase
VGKPRPMRERRGVAFTMALLVVKPLLRLLTRPHWIDGHKLPATGGAVIAANHVSHADPLTFAHFVHDHGRVPRYLAKAVLFDVFLVGWVLRSSGQIPTYRLTADAARAFEAAVTAVEHGQVVIVYPEGTLTRDPELWPMRGRTGAARIALTADVPVIPVAQWGAQDFLWPYTKRPRLLPPTHVYAKVGDPVDLDDLRGRPITHEVLVEATERIMTAITCQLEDVRGEQGPTVRFDPRAVGMREIGNPYDQEARQRRRRRKR